MDLWIVALLAGPLAFLIFFAIEKFKANKTDNTDNSTDYYSSTKEESKEKNDLINYSIYKLSLKEKIFYIIAGATVIYIIGFVFYRSHIISSVLMPLAFFYPKIRAKELMKKRKNEFNLQFKDGLYSLSSSLSAGKSIELAFKDALIDLSIIYPDPDTYIIKEFEYIIRKLDMNETIEQALSDLSRRSHLEDISSFVDVFITTKRTGGNIVKVIKNTSEIISDKIRIKQEIDTMITQKKLEQKVLNFIPVFMILFLSWTAPDYMDMVFNTILGRIIMTITVMLLTVSYFISKKIMDIEV